jgi:DNA (cytosine-5)-methyltransferase 1
LSKPILLDLFCGAGGASVGYERAGFSVFGVDINPQPNYPLFLIQFDAMEIPLHILNRVEVIHASPPCQRYSDLAKRNKNADAWPDYIAQLREKLIATGLPYIIENVEGAPLINPIRLCGVSFPPLRVIRHRLFESNIPLIEPEHQKHPLVYTMDKRKRQYGMLDERTSFVMVNGGGNCSVDTARDAMGIDWMTKRELNEAIPPAYTEYIGKQVLARIHEGTSSV